MITPPAHIAQSYPRQFIDREEFIAFFKSALNRENINHHKIIVFYGIGGIGKTRLIKEMHKNIKNDSKTLSVFLDFKNSYVRDLEGALTYLRYYLSDNYKIKFNIFDIAFAIYWGKAKPHIPLNKENYPFIENTNILAEVFSIIENVPIVGLIPKIGIAIQKFWNYLEDWWIKYGKEEFEKLIELLPSEILYSLPRYFSEDLKLFFEEKTNRAVIFIDTYEALWEGKENRKNSLMVDGWLRELITFLPQVLWVICSRDKINWEGLDHKWGNCIEQSFIGKLASSDIEHYLQSSGIVERVILKSSV